MGSRNGVNVRPKGRPAGWGRLAAALALVATVAGCSAVGGSTIVEPPAVNALTVSPPAVSIAAGGLAASLTANVSVSGGASQAVTWSSSDPSVALVSPNGRSATITGVKVGTVIITATSAVDANKSSGSQVTVTPGAVASITLSAATATVAAFGTLPVQALVRDANGNTVTAASLTWSSSNQAVATVSPTGVVTGRLPGTVNISATSGSVSSNVVALTVVNPPVASVEVSASGAVIARFGTLQAQAVPRDAGGNALTGIAVTWNTSNALVATVSASGLITAVNPGLVNITASAGSVTSAPLAITVVNPPVASIVISASTATVVAFTTLQVQAVAKDAAGNVLTGVPLAWASSAGQVASVSNSGFVTGLSPGGVNITVSSGSVTSNALALTVINPPIASIAVSATTATVSIGGTLQMQFVARDAGGNALSGVSLNWNSSNVLVAGVSNTGLVTGRLVGTSQISASSGAVTSNNVTVTVTP